MFRLLAFLLSLLFPAGGDDDPDDDTQPSDPPADDDTDPADDDDGDDDTGAGGSDSDLDEEALRSELSKARREAAKYRTQRNAERERIENLEDQNRRILEALGIADDNDDDPSAEAERLRQENRRLRTRQSFDAAAREAGADEDLTWGYLLARGDIDALDPDSDDHAETLQERITQALEAKPSLAVKPPPPPKGGADLDQRGDPDATPEDELPMKDFMERYRERRGLTTKE